MKNRLTEQLVDWILDDPFRTIVAINLIVSGGLIALAIYMILANAHK